MAILVQSVVDCDKVVSIRVVGAAGIDCAQTRFHPPVIVRHFMTPRNKRLSRLEVLEEE